MDALKRCVGNILFSFQSSFRASKKYFTAKCAIAVVTIGIPLITFGLWREILNGITYGAPVKTVLCSVAAYLALELLLRAVGKVNDYILVRYRESMNFYFEKVTLEKTARMELAFFDSSSMADKISRAQADRKSVV